MDYVGTISDDDLGHINCMAASLKDGKMQMITGGSELRVWNQVPANNGKKRPARCLFIHGILLLCSL